MPLIPIDSGELENCPTAMSERLKALIPDIEKALEDADGENAYVVYKFDDVRKEVGSSAVNPYGFVACLNRLLEANFKNRTDIAAHTQRGADVPAIRFDHVKPSQIKRVATP